MGFKLNVPAGAKSNAIQHENKAAQTSEKSAQQNSTPQEAPIKKATGLVIPGKKSAESATNNSAGSNSISPRQGPGVADETQPAQSLKQELENLPAGVDEKVYADFLEARNNLTQCLTDNKDMIGYALRRVMVDLKLHPELADFMLPEDYGAMIRSLRTSYGATLAIKEKKSRKKKNGGNKSADISMDNLKDMLIDLS